MPDIVTTQVFSDGEKGITATKMNNIVANSTIQTDFIANKPSSATLDPTDQMLELKAGGTYARITGAQLSSSVAAQLALANTSQAGMLHQTSGNIGDYCGGDNQFHILNTFVSLTAATTLTTADINKYLICSGGSWTLTLPTAANGLAYRLRNDMGISGTTGIITVTPPAGLIDGAATLKLLPQQECEILCDGTNWRSLELKREVILGTQDISSSTASASILLPAGYRAFQLDWHNCAPVTDRSALFMRVSFDGGSTWQTGTIYRNSLIWNSSATAVANVSNMNVANGYINGAVCGAGYPNQSRLVLTPGSASSACSYIADGQGYDGTGAYVSQSRIVGYLNANGLVNALQYYFSSGNIANSLLTVKGVV